MTGAVGAAVSLPVVAGAPCTFSGALSFDQNLDSWDVGNVRVAAETFFQAKSFDQALHSWRLGSVTSVEFMFQGAAAFIRNQ